MPQDIPAIRDSGEPATYITQKVALPKRTDIWSSEGELSSMQGNLLRQPTRLALPLSSLSLCSRLSPV